MTARRTVTRTEVGDRPLCFSRVVLLMTCIEHRRRSSAFNNNNNNKPQSMSIGIAGDATAEASSEASVGGAKKLVGESGPSS